MAIIFETRNVKDSPCPEGAKSSLHEGDRYYGENPNGGVDNRDLTPMGAKNRIEMHTLNVGITQAELMSAVKAPLKPRGIKPLRKIIID